MKKIVEKKEDKIIEKPKLSNLLFKNDFRYKKRFYSNS